MLEPNTYYICKTENELRNEFERFYNKSHQAFDFHVQSLDADGIDALRNHAVTSQSRGLKYYMAEVNEIQIHIVAFTTEDGGGWRIPEAFLRVATTEELSCILLNQF